MHAGKILTSKYKILVRVYSTWNPFRAKRTVPSLLFKSVLISNILEAGSKVNIEVSNAVKSLNVNVYTNTPQLG